MRVGGVGTKTIGLIGGTSWVSTLEYYRLINEETNRRLGGLEAARCILYSFNFADIVRLKANDPEQREVRPLVLEAARTLENAGAECLVLCANTLHLFAEDVENSVAVPLVHIAVATAAEIKRQKMSKVGLLGTRATMEQDFYRRRLRDAGIEPLVPEAEERTFIDEAIMTEMVKGVFRDDVRHRFLEIIGRLAQRGAQGIVLGCTELPLLIKPADTELPLFDTLAIHSRAAVDLAMSGV